MHDLLDRFENAWQQVADGCPPKLSKFALPAGDPNGYAVWLELVKIDLEYRWRKYGGLTGGSTTGQAMAVWKLEDYFEEYAGFSAGEETPADLIEHEYRCRHWWGDRPGREEYKARFPHHNAILEKIATDKTPPVATWLTGHDDRPSKTRTARETGRFGDYLIVREIERGGMGIVYEARQISLDRVVALKMIRSGEFADEVEVRRFRNEAEAAAQLDHPNIVPVFDVGDVDGQHYFSMGLVKGRSLRQRLNSGPMSPLEAAKLVEKIARAVQFAHQHGIIHRDLKPANVLLDGDDEPRVTDFGLAKRTTVDSAVTQTGQILGTPGYMPPEQAAGRIAEVGPQSDVYSLGAILYATLTGRPPFQAANSVETVKQVTDQDPVSPRKLNPSVPRDLETICLKCLRKQSNSRYSTAKELADDLLCWRENRPILARRIGYLPRAKLWCKRKPVVAGAVVAVTVTLVASTLILRTIIRNRDQQAQEDKNSTTAIGLVDSLANADIDRIPEIVIRLDAYRRWADPLLRERFVNARDGSPEKLRLSLALLPVDENQIPYLQYAILDSDIKSVRVIRDALQPHRAAVTSALWDVLLSDNADPGRRLNAACVLAAFDRSNGKRWDAVMPFVAVRLVKTLARNLRDIETSLELLEPIKTSLAVQLTFIVHDTQRTDLERSIALNVVLENVSGDSKKLSDLLANAEHSQFGLIFDRLIKNRGAAILHLTAILSERWNIADDESRKERLAKRKANVAAALLRLGEKNRIWPLFDNRPDPRVRSYLIHRAAPLGVKPQLYARRLEKEPNAAVRAGLLLTLGEYSESRFSISERRKLKKKLVEVYKTDPDPGLHGCAEWLLRVWNHREPIHEVKKRLGTVEKQRMAVMRNGQRRWYVTTQGHTFSVVKAAVFEMGSPMTEAGRDATREQPVLRKIGRDFAISAHEVTVRQFADFLKAVQGSAKSEAYQKEMQNYCSSADSPAVAISWYDAARYCNWLSSVEGIPPDQWCYEANAKGEYADGMKAKADFLNLAGYRLPTEAEWEYACRGTTVTSRYFGSSAGLLRHYARYQSNSDDHLWPVGGLKPNTFGLFDTLGNCLEWCHTRYSNAAVGKPKSTIPAMQKTQSESIYDDSLRLLRGGSFVGRATFIRSAARMFNRPTHRFDRVGFRPARTLP